MKKRLKHTWFTILPFTTSWINVSSISARSAIFQLPATLPLWFNLHRSMREQSKLKQIQFQIQSLCLLYFFSASQHNKSNLKFVWATNHHYFIFQFTIFARLRAAVERIFFFYDASYVVNTVWLSLARSFCVVGWPDDWEITLESFWCFELIFNQRRIVEKVMVGSANFVLFTRTKFPYDSPSPAQYVCD